MAKQQILTIPHPLLRITADPVVEVSTYTLQTIAEIERLLRSARNPRGVGLAATQIGATERIFATLLNEELRMFINPVITAHSDQTTLGGTPDDPDLEGCLSIPRLYGPVPRWQWLELAFLEMSHDNTLVKKTERFDHFPARVIQHERDHLDGILFFDHSLEYDLPVFEGTRGDKLEPIDPMILETLVAKSRI